ncbi:MAG: hypothetical protein ACOY0R_04605 [Chloroflexota bacterium]
MNKFKLFKTVTFLTLVVILSACTVGAPPPTPTLTASPLPSHTPLPTHTHTPQPTATPTFTPTATPNATATRQADDIQAILKVFMDNGVLDSAEGTSKALPDYRAEFAQRGYWSDLYDTGETLPDTFMIRAHMKWESASSGEGISGCGVAFGVQENDDNYLVILDKDRILFTLKRGYWSYVVGRTNGPAGPEPGTPTEHDFALMVKGQTAYVWVDGAVTTYTLSADQVSSGKLAFTVLSGSNTDFGTRCEMTNILLWTKTEQVVQTTVDFPALLEKFKEKGYIDTTEGQQVSIPDFEKTMAQKGWYYKWGFAEEAQAEYGNFVFSAHFKWDSYSSTPDVSGCGIGFGIKDDGAHYAVFLDQANLVFAQGTDTTAKRMGAANDSGRFPAIPKPAEADFAAAVWNNNLYVLVNDVFVHYILPSDQDALGRFALSLLSGGNSGYGTRCEMTNIILWTPK